MLEKNRKVLIDAVPLSLILLGSFLSSNSVLTCDWKLRNICRDNDVLAYHLDEIVNPTIVAVITK